MSTLDILEAAADRQDRLQPTGATLHGHAVKFCPEHDATTLDFCLLCQYEAIREYYRACYANIVKVRPLENYTEFHCGEHGAECQYVATVQFEYLPMVGDDPHYWDDHIRNGWRIKPGCEYGKLACGRLVLWAD